MKKYKLIKTYPGSPDLGTEVQEHNTKSGFYYDEHRTSVLRYHVENQPEYWEEVNDDIYYLVFTEDEASFKAWKPYRTETMPFDTDSKKYFKTNEQANDFILYNKPCLSYKDVSFISRFNVKSKEDVLLLEFSPSKLTKLIKERI